MKYWNTYEELDFETYSTNYLQVVWDDGTDCEYWSKDSLYINGQKFDNLNGMRVLRSSGALPYFDFYYNTIVYQEDWERMTKILSNMGGEYEVFISELAEWVGNGGFDTHMCFTIIGV